MGRGRGVVVSNWSLKISSNRDSNPRTQNSPLTSISEFLYLVMSVIMLLILLMHKWIRDVYKVDFSCMAGFIADLLELSIPVCWELPERTISSTKGRNRNAVYKLCGNHFSVSHGGCNSIPVMSVVVEEVLASSCTASPSVLYSE